MLRASSLVIGMHSVDALKVAWTRGWIFQELAFGELDADGLGRLFSIMRDLGLALVGEGTEANLEAFAVACSTFANLLADRGYVQTWKRDNTLLALGEGLSTPSVLFERCGAGIISRERFQACIKKNIYHE